MNKQKLSVSMIVKNQSSCLRECLQSVKQADQIVIVDTGSQDNTIQIAKQYTDKVYFGQQYLWRDDFAFSRNQSLQKCTGDWILIMDADSVLQQNGIKKIRDIIDNEPKSDSYKFELVSINNTSSHYLITLFKNNGQMKWNGKIHNYLKGKSGKSSQALDIKVIYHYSQAHKKDPDRAFRILKKQIKEDSKNARNLYYLARQYWYRHDYITASYYFKQCIKHSKFNGQIADAYLYLARCLFYLYNGDQARDACTMAIRINPDFKQALQFMAELHYQPMKSKWLQFSQLANNQNVLFVRRRLNKKIVDK